MVRDFHRRSRRRNRIFSAFDDLAEKHGREKIKTIGDAYMVAGGFPEQRNSHAGQVAGMALDMLTALEACNQKEDYAVSIRIGMRSGPAVAGVIGIKKFVYDVWCDTVNTASRMESSGCPGRIQISQSTAAMLDGEFAIEERGAMEVKGREQ